MSYLILQIVVFLVSAAALGIGFGWWLGRRSVTVRVEEEREAAASAVAVWQSRHQEALSVSEAARERISFLENELDEMRRSMVEGSTPTLPLKKTAVEGKQKVLPLEMKRERGNR